MKRIFACALAAIMLLCTACAESTASVRHTDPAEPTEEAVTTQTPTEKTPSETPTTQTPEPLHVTVIPTDTPVVPTEPTDTPVVPTEPTDTPVVPTEPTDTPVVPTEPTDTPVVPTEPTETPVVPTEPTDTPVVPTESTETPTVPVEEPFVPFTLAFTGDINLAENYKILPNAVSKGRTVEECFSPAILAHMRGADLLLVNCESSVSDRGAALVGKNYTFRTSRKTALAFRDVLGADLIGLANNHVYDFGKDAFLDTLDTFAEMGLPTVGAGRNTAEAYKPYYYEHSGMKIAIVATSRAEKNYYTLVAEEDEPGICGCYDETLVCREIAEAKENADFVIVFVHYGYEGTTQIENVQRSASYHFVEAGADLVVGGHSHCLQGIDEHNGKLIFYSLGNYLFNLKEMPTALLELRFESKDDYTLRILPAMQTDGTVMDEIGTETGEAILQDLRRLSIGIAIDKDGYVYNTVVYDGE